MDESGQVLTPLFLVYSSEGDTGRTQVDSHRPSLPTWVRACRAAQVRALPCCLHRPRRSSLPGADDVRRQGRRHRMAVRAPSRDRDGGVGATGRCPRGTATGVPDVPRIRRTLAGDPPDAWPRATPYDRSAISDAAGPVHLPDLRRGAHRPDHTRGRQRLVRPGGSGPGHRQGTGVQPAAHDPRRCRLRAAHSPHPVQPGSHPWRRNRQACPPGRAGDAVGDRDDRHGAARPLPADGAARRLVCAALRRAGRVTPR